MIQLLAFASNSIVFQIYDLINKEFCDNLGLCCLFSSIPLRLTFVAQPLRLDTYSARLRAWTPTLVATWDDQYAITQQLTNAA
jgi:hypothetical protein